MTKTYAKIKFGYLIISIAASATYEGKPYLSNHSKAISTKGGHSHVRDKANQYWRDYVDNTGVEVKINNNQMTVQHTGMKLYAQTGSWLEIQNDVTLPSHCELFAVPADYKPTGTLDDNIEALKERNKLFAVAQLHGGNQLTVRVKSLGGMKGSSSTSVPSLLLTASFVSLALFILIRQ